jgi:hypothetical protein
MLQLSERQCRALFDTLYANLPEAVETLLAGSSSVTGRASVPASPDL